MALLLASCVLVLVVCSKVVLRLVRVLLHVVKLLVVKVVRLWLHVVRVLVRVCRRLISGLFEGLGLGAGAGAGAGRGLGPLGLGAGLGAGPGLSDNIVVSVRLSALVRVMPFLHLVSIPCSNGKLLRAVCRHMGLIHSRLLPNGRESRPLNLTLELFCSSSDSRESTAGLVLKPPRIRAGFGTAAPSGNRRIRTPLQLGLGLEPIVTNVVSAGSCRGVKAAASENDGDAVFGTRNARQHGGRNRRIGRAGLNGMT